MLAAALHKVFSKGLFFVDYKHRRVQSLPMAILETCKQR